MDRMRWFATVVLATCATVATCVTIVTLRKSLSKRTTKSVVEAPMEGRKVESPAERSNETSRETVSKRTPKFIVEAPTERQEGRAPAENSGENSGESPGESSDESPGESSGESIVEASVKSRKGRKFLDVQTFAAGSSLPKAAPTSFLRTKQYSKKRKKVEARKKLSPAARFWEDAIDKFETGETFDGQEYIVRVSSMSYEEQQIFVEAATYFYDEPLEQALAAWDSAYGNSHEKWKKLLSMSMVREVHKSTSHSLGEIREDQDVTVVWVHELLRDVAKSLLKDHVGSASKIFNWLRADTDILQLPSGNRKYDTDFDGSHIMLPTDLLDKCEVLKYVDLDGVILEGLHENFGTNLRLLRWDMRSMTQLPPIALEKLDNLFVLELSNWRVPTEFSEALENLSNLRILSLGHLEGLNRLPDSFGQLRGLKRLELVGLSLLALPISFGDLVYLQHLSLVNLRIATLPNSFGMLSSLEHLSFVNVKLQSLPDSVGKLSSLRTMAIRNCEEIQYLPESFGLLSTLQHLSFVNVKLQSLPESFGELGSLRTMAIRNCQEIQSLPESFGMLSSLQHLSLVNLRIATLPDSFGQLSSLQHLFFVNVKLQSLPDNFGELSSLRTMAFRYCDYLEVLPHSFRNLIYLEELVVHECRQLMRLPDNFEALPTLTIENDDQLKAFSDSFGKLRYLRRLTLVNVSTFSTLPDSIGDLTSLVTLTIRSCKNLESLPPSFVSFGHPGSSRELVLHRCKQLTKLPDIFGPLMILTIQEDDQLEALSSCLRELTTLRRMTLVNVSSVELPESLLDGLVMLAIRSCQTLSCLPSSFGRLSSLKELYIENCPLFSTLQGLEPDDSVEKELGDSIQVPWSWFISLENLTLSGCRITSELLRAILDTRMRVFVTSLALTRLDLHDNLLEDQAFQILLTWADHLQHLKELDLSMNKGMNSSGLMSLIETIQSGLLPSLQRVNWVGNRYSEATAQAVTQAYYEDESLTTHFDVDWTSVNDISMRPKVEEYRDRNERLKDLKVKLKSEYKPNEELHEALPLSSVERLEEKLETEENVQMNVSKEKVKTEDKPKEELHEDLPLSSAKVFLCGFPEVGKTTLRKTLFDPLRSREWWFSWRKEPRTRGIELSRVEEMKENEDSLTLVLWDLAGQEEFHVLHSSFFPDLGFASGKATTFVLVFNAAWRKEVKEEIKYWLGFAASSSLTHAKRHVMIVLNQFGGKQCTDDDLQLWRNLVNLFAERFDDLLQIHSDPIIIDARDPQSVQPLKDRLFNHARKLLENVMVPGVCILLQQVLKEWAQGDKKTYLPILSWQSFESILLSKHKRIEWSGELLRTSALYLHEIGEIIYFDNKEQTGAGSEHRGLVVPEPQWFCRHIVGELLLPERMLKGERPIEVSSYGSISIIEFKSFFKDKLPVGTGEDDVISMLEQMGLGYKKGAEEIIIPALISEHNTSKVWEGEGFLWVMGRCLTTEDMERLPIPSILFRKLQAELAQNFGDRVDSKYIAGKSFSNFTDGEHLVLIEFGLKPSDRACGRVDILVKTIQESENPKVRWAQIECISRIMKKLESLCVKYCPGVKYDIKVMEPWNACDKTPRMADRNLMSLKRIKNLLREGNDYSGWRLNKGQKEVAVKYEWLLSNSEWKEGRKEDPSKSTGIKFSAVNDSLYELHTPPLDTTPNVEILFFHGIREEGGSEDAHFSTWKSGDDTCIWPQKWLAETFPRARILFVYFDSVVKGKSGSLRFDMDRSDTYLITENLATDLTQGHVGQTLNRPVIMVGHCLGGMVIKELLLRVFSGSNFTTDTPKFKRLMNNVKGIFYYDTPHHGTILEPQAGLNVANNNLLRYFQALDERAARVNDEFGKLRRTFPKWRIGGLGAKLPTNSVLFHDDVVVPEASSREGDDFNMIDEDHYSICKPESKITKSFTSLETVIKDVLVDMQAVDIVKSLQSVHLSGVHLTHEHIDKMRIQ